MVHGMVPACLRCCGCERSFYIRLQPQGPRRTDGTSPCCIAAASAIPRILLVVSYYTY